MKAGVESRETRRPAEYEPPALRSLGLVDELTAGADSQDSLVKTEPVSDERAKAGVSLLVGALARLRRL